jgi:hypothetical protein
MTGWSAAVENQNVSPEDFAKIIDIAIVPETQGPPHTFWCHTSGLAEIGLAEWELRNVSPIFVRAAVGVLNEWAYVSGVLEAGHPCTEHPFDWSPIDGLTVKLHPTLSDDKHWSGSPHGCLRMVVVGIDLGCNVCDGNCRGH